MKRGWGSHSMGKCKDNCKNDGRKESPQTKKSNAKQKSKQTIYYFLTAVFHTAETAADCWLSLLVETSP